LAVQAHRSWLREFLARLWMRRAYRTGGLTARGHAQGKK
jgi:hypothetical protein